MGCSQGKASSPGAVQDAGKNEKPHTLLEAGASPQAGAKAVEQGQGLATSILTNTGEVVPVDRFLEKTAPAESMPATEPQTASDEPDVGEPSFLNQVLEQQKMRRTTLENAPLNVPEVVDTAATLPAAAAVATDSMAMDAPIQNSAPSGSCGVPDASAKAGGGETEEMVLSITAEQMDSIDDEYQKFVERNKIVEGDWNLDGVYDRDGKQYVEEEGVENKSRFPLKYVFKKRDKRSTTLAQEAVNHPSSGQWGKRSTTPTQEAVNHPSSSQWGKGPTERKQRELCCC